MRRIRNATDGQRLFRDELRNFNEYYRRNVERIRCEYSQHPLDPAPPKLDDLLEEHARKYLIDRLLICLNWNILLEDDPKTTNVVPEAPIVSVVRETTRYLDYFGMEQESGAALLILESKRSGSPLPALKNRPARTAESVTGLDIAQAILAGLKGEVEDHYRDPASFELLKGVTESRQNEFVLLTGTDSHFFRKTPSVAGCPFHDWQKIGNNDDRHPADAPLLVSSTEQRAFFVVSFDLVR